MAQRPPVAQGVLSASGSSHRCTVAHVSVCLSRDSGQRTFGTSVVKNGQMMMSGWLSATAEIITSSDRAYSMVT